MATQRRKEEWDRTTELWYILANANRNTEMEPKPFTRDMVHPYRTATDYKPEQPQHGDLSGLKAIIQGTRNGKSR